MAKKQTKPRYEVLTWDWDAHEFTPQQGVRCGPYSLWGLKRALRKLQSLGYDCGRPKGTCGDPSVFVARIN